MAWLTWRRWPISAFVSPRATRPSDLALPLGQLVEHRRVGPRLGPWIGRTRPREPLDEAPGDARCQQRVARSDDADGLDELLGRHVLEEEAAGAGTEGAVDVLVEVERGEDDDAHAIELGVRRDDRRGGDAVEAWHAYVHQQDVGVGGAGELDRCVTVGGLTHELEVGGMGHEGAEPGTDQRLVVGDRDADHVAVPACGMVAWTRKPAPSRRGPASNVPPYSAARSRMPTSPSPPFRGATVPRPSSTTSSTTWPGS